MPTRVSCPGCGRAFQAADRLAGRRVKCPDCGTPIDVPAPPRAQTAHVSGQPSGGAAPAGGPAAREDEEWYAETVDGREHGPVTKAEVERLVAAGRMNLFCRVRHEAWSDWKWAGDLFPELSQTGGSASTGGEGDAASSVASPSGPPAEQPEGARVVACPDCGQMVSRRASHCPHCGCPAAVLRKQAPTADEATRRKSAEPADDGLDAGLPGRSTGKSRGFGGNRGSAWVVHAAVGLLMIAVAGLGVAWWLWRSRPLPSPQSVAAETLLKDLSQPAEPPPAAPTPADENPFASAEARQAAIEEAAAEVARRLDGEFRAAQAAKALLDQTQVSAEMLEALAQGDLDAIPDRLPAGGPAEDAPPAEPLYDSLFDECLAYLDENVPREKSTKKAVWETARRWEQQKRASLEEQFTEDLTERLAPGR